MGEETTFFKYLDEGHKEFDNEIHKDEDAYPVHLYKEFKRTFWNHLHSIIFGADEYKAFKQQKDYLLNKLVKPYSVTVEAAFRRIEVITILMAHFPLQAVEVKQPRLNSGNNSKKKEKRSRLP